MQKKGNDILWLAVKMLGKEGIYCHEAESADVIEELFKRYFNLRLDELEYIVNMINSLQFQKMVKKLLIGMIGSVAHNIYIKQNNLKI